MLVSYGTVQKRHEIKSKDGDIHRRLVDHVDATTGELGMESAKRATAESFGNLAYAAQLEVGLFAAVGVPMHSMHERSVQ